MAMTPMENKIAALLAKAESTDSPHEAEALSEAAAKLMLKHGIEQAMVDAARTGSEKRDEISQEILTFIGSHAKEWVGFVNAIAQGYGSLKLLRMTTRDYGGTNKEMERVYIMGFSSDLAQFLSLQASLQLQAISAQKKWWKSYDAKRYMSAGEKWREREEFLRNFSYAAGRKIREARSQAVDEAGEGTAIVLMDREKLVDEWMNARHSIGKAKTSRRQGGSWAAAGAGAAAGSQAGTGSHAVSGRTAIGAR